MVGNLNKIKSITIQDVMKCLKNTLNAQYPMEEGEERLMKWAKEIGITDSPTATSSPSCLSYSLSLSYFPNAGGRGLGAARDLKRGEMILRVPKHALITPDCLINQDHQLLSLLLLNNNNNNNNNTLLPLSSTQKLTVCLLYEVGKGKISRWYPYLSQLPRSYDILATFSALEIQSLQVNDAIWAAERAIEKAEFDWQQAIGVMEQLHLKRHLRTFKAWVWSFATISSRTLHIPWDDAGCLCPVGDLFNYDPPGEEINCEISNNRKTISSSDSNNENLLRLTDGGYEEDSSAYCFYARRNYNKGEQVLLSYGTYTNLELLEHYGFLLDTNPNGKAFIPLEPEIYTSCSWPKDSLFIHQNGIPSFALLSTLRFWLTPPSQRRSIGHLIYSGSQLSPENEITVMKWIIKNCKLVLEKLPTSIEKDKLLVCTIDKMQDFCSFNHFESVVSSFEDADCAVLESKGLINRDKKVLLECKPIGRCLDKWRLAVQWRLLYKRTLADCVTYCAKVMTELGFQNDL